ncbi:MAG: DUF4011 domain-containing protein [Verrucomicrobiae bacterium]|nr:DUF4011 domain-containing protein [Verrucomicrobiae bacterium]
MLANLIKSEPKVDFAQKGNSLSMIDVDAKIETWKNKLLDLGKRNRLLNYRDSKRSALKILKPECFALFDSFVQNEQPLVFPTDSEIEELTQEIDKNILVEDGEEEEVDEGDDDFAIKTNQGPKETLRTLKSMREKAKTAIEEQGINILYLSFGFLRWTESPNSNYRFNSPILLVPVSLTIESIISPYTLSLHEDEIIINPTLAYKLENDFGITLPKYSEDDDLASILDEIETLAKINHWEVVPEAGLSLLSFLKINMYNDLSRNKEAIVANPIIRAISGDASASNTIPAEFVNFDHDRNTNPNDMYQVVDADSSQQDAILCAKKGLSFVLQGPPGTGKSQTITNIIAECLADGKKVLFVSEKMAALDVVHRRLSSAGLDPFCLTLHSHKANKRAVLDQLGATLALAQNKATLRDDAFQILESLQADKQNLNEYADQVFATVMPLGRSIYQVNGELAHLEPYDFVIFQLDNVGEVSNQQYNRYLYLLQQLTTTIGKMSDDYKANPWYGAIIPAVTHELRHDIGTKLGMLIPKVETAQQQLHTLYEQLSLEWRISHMGMQKVIPVLEKAAEAHKVPESWILGNSIEPLFGEIAECESLKAQFWQKQDALASEYVTITANDATIDLSSLHDLVTAETIDKEMESIGKNLANHSPYMTMSVDSSSAEQLLEEATEKAKQLQDIISQLSAVYEESVFSIDYNDILSRFKTDYTSILKVFNKSYKADKKLIQSQFRQIVRKVSDEQALELLTQLRTRDDLKHWFVNNRANFSRFFGDLLQDENSDFVRLGQYMQVYRSLTKSISLLEELRNTAAKLEGAEQTLVAHYQFLYKGFDTEWVHIRAALTWAASFRKQVEEHQLNRSFVEAVCTGQNKPEIYREAVVQIASVTGSIDREFQWFLDFFDNRDVFTELELSTLQDRLLRCRNGLALLEEWIDFRAVRENCQADGLADYLAKIDELHIETANIIPIFKKRFFRLWLDAILPNYPAVLHFRRRVHEGSINQFARYDKLQFEIAKARIKGILINKLPSTQRFTNSADEISVLKRELGKQRRIMPIRRLFREIPNLLLTLKPCLMMSPLSVSLFLEAESYQFDTVIFDEASQVCTENAIGAISRGKQVIITGDSKQLPPTNFFTVSTTSDDEYDTDDDDYDDADAYESILDEAILLPERTLLWHYRSRHEHLIAFSNAKIYKNNLITFPSNIDKMPDNGVEYIHVRDGFYDRGGKKGNVIEAQKVAEIVFDHFRNYPKRTLGVVAFGEIQQQAIDAAIRVKRMEHQNLEHFFKEETDEPFFIKNLENVQGDERDTIIFSIGYAKDAAGVFRMNFGPLSKSGGERRLNVAITRAKHNVKLVGSIMPTDIDVDRISLDGPKLLRSYIDFAINGADTLVREITEFDQTTHDSPFEASVYNYLDRRGYKVATQVGCSGYRIDMAVKHPNLSGVYVLGVECDGASYHSARTARERDRLRQEVLENMGWNIHRIWSTDWIKDPVTEGENLITAINEAITRFENSSASETVDLDSTDEPDADDFVSVDIIEPTIAEQVNPYEFPPAQITDINALMRENNGHFRITDGIIACVNTEFPIHFELLAQRLAPVCGNEKATSRVKREVERGLLSLRGKIVRKGDFLFPAGWEKITVRVPNSRKINHISTQELAKAMQKILPAMYGITRDGLCAETTRVYGWQRMTQGIKTAMDEACDLLIRQGWAQENDGKIVAKESQGWVQQVNKQATNVPHTHHNSSSIYPTA